MGQDKSKHANIKVEIDGKTKLVTQTGEGEIETFGGMHITRLQVDKRLDCPDMFSVDYNLIIRSKMTFIDSIKEGQPVKVYMGYGSTSEMEVVFDGEISYIEPHFATNGHGTLTVSGYDQSHRLTRGSRSKTWDDPKTEAFDYPQVVQEVIQKSGGIDGGSDSLSTDSVTSEQPPRFRHVPQLNMSDYSFVKSLGVDLGQKTGADTQDGKKVSFQKVDVSSPKVTIVREKLEGSNPHFGRDVRFRLSTVKQVSRVEVRGVGSQAEEEHRRGRRGPDSRVRRHEGPRCHSQSPVRRRQGQEGRRHRPPGLRQVRSR